MNNWGDNQEGPDLGALAAPLGHVDDWGELAVDYLDGSADPVGRMAVEAHLADCPTCATRLQSQRETGALLRSLSLAEAPADLEDRILGELLFPSQVIPLPEPPRETISSLWHRRLRKWVPAAAAVAAVLVGMVAWGLINPPDEPQVASEQAAVTSVAAGPAPANLSADNSSDTGSAVGGGQPEDSEAPATTASATETTTTAGGSATTTDARINPASEGSTPVTVTDRGAMVAVLAESAGPVYVAFTPEPAETEGDSAGQTDTTAPENADTDTTGDPAAPSNGSSEPSPDATAEKGGSDEEYEGRVTGASSDWIEETVEQLQTFTELRPLPASLSPERPVYAAYLDHDNVKAFVDLLRSIASSIRLQVSLQTEAGEMWDIAALIASHKDEYPVLLSHVLGQPSVARYGFTTTSLPPQGSGAETPYPDEAGTHVLTIIFMKP